MQLEQSLRQLRLPSFIANYSSVATEIEQQKNISLVEYLEALVQLELESRAQNKVARLVKKAGLHNHKLLVEFELNEVPSLLPSKLYELAQGAFIDRVENLLIFGATGTGKTHLCSGLAHKWCLLGKRVYYTKAGNLAAELASAQATSTTLELRKKLDKNDVIIIDDLLLYQYTKTEQALLMNLLSDYYEIKSLVISAHLPFARWSEALNNELAVMMVVDKLVHHSIIVELNTESYRAKQAKKKQLNLEGKQKTINDN
jgi:DNA replication protein DnaC